MKVKLLQWNVRVSERVENTLREIKRINPDIVCLQELTKGSNFNKDIYDIPKYLGENLDFNYFFKEQQTWNMHLDRTFEYQVRGVGIFTRFPIINEFFTYTFPPFKKPKDMWSTGRVYIEVGAEVNSKKITIGTTHVGYTHKFAITNSKKEEVNKLINIIKSKKQQFVFTGDLNSIPESYAIKQISKYLKHLGPSSNQKSWTTKMHGEKGFVVDALKYRLDYVFGTEDIKVNSSRILKTDVSDHLPILVEFEV